MKCECGKTQRDDWAFCPSCGRSSKLRLLIIGDASEERWAMAVWEAAVPLGHGKYDRETKRDAVYMVTVHGLTIAEVSGNIGCDPGTVSGWIAEVKERLGHAGVFQDD